MARYRYPGLGERMQEALTRKGKGWNPHKLSKELQVAYTTVFNWMGETSTPTIRNVERVADMLDVSVNWLLYGEEQRTESAQVHPSLETFAATHKLAEDERKHLESHWFGFGDPGDEYWLQALGAYRSAKRLRTAQEGGANLAREGDLVPVKKKPTP